MSESEVGLRELKKQMTHGAIAEAAWRLVVDKGLPHVTIEEIARTALVSPRTVSNYFSSKEEAVVAASWPEWTPIVDQFADRPQDEAPLPALSRLLAAFVRGLPEDVLELNRDKVRLSGDHPTLASVLASRVAAFEHAVRAALSVRSGEGPRAEMHTELVAASAGSAVRSAVRLWVGAGSDDLAELIEDAFAQLAAGLPEPGRDESSDR